MRGMTTVEWLVIAAIVLVASKYVIDYWTGIWNPTKEKAETMSNDFGKSLDKLTSQLPLPSHQAWPLESLNSFLGAEGQPLL